MNRLLAIALAIMIVMSACSSDPLEEYFDGVSELTATMRSDSLAALPNPAEPTHASVAAVNAARQAAADALGALAPPTEVRPEHMSLLLALSDLAEAGDRFLDVARDLSAIEFADTIRIATDIDETAARVMAACDAMQHRADELGYTARIRC